MERRTPVRQKAKELAVYLRDENPDYKYLKTLYKHLLEEFGIERSRKPKKAPYAPSSEELQRFYDLVQLSHRAQERLMILLFLHSDIRIDELAEIRIFNVNMLSKQIQLDGQKGRLLPIPTRLEHDIYDYADQMNIKKANYLFESSWGTNYTERGFRKMFARYCEKAGMQQALSPYKLRRHIHVWIERQAFGYRDT